MKYLFQLNSILSNLIRNSQEKLRLKIYQRFADIITRRRIIRKPSRILIDGRQCNVGFFTDINNGERGRAKSKKREVLSEALIQRSRHIAGIGGVR